MFKVVVEVQVQSEVMQDLPLLLVEQVELEKIHHLYIQEEERMLVVAVAVLKRVVLEEQLEIQQVMQETLQAIPLIQVKQVGLIQEMVGVELVLDLLLQTIKIDQGVLVAQEL
jgi:hypothetical protein